MSTQTMEVANTILQQLGGRRFGIMTGAKNFIATEDGLSFRLPSNFASKGINAVRVDLIKCSDTYLLTFIKVRGTKITIVEMVTNVYCDQLQEIFTAQTGLQTRL